MHVRMPLKVWVKCSTVPGQQTSHITEKKDAAVKQKPWTSFAVCVPCTLSPNQSQGKAGLITRKHTHTHTHTRVSVPPCVHWTALVESPQKKSASTVWSQWCTPIHREREGEGEGKGEGLVITLRTSAIPTNKIFLIDAQSKSSTIISISRSH